MKIDSVKWKAAVPTRGIDAQKAYRALEALRQKNGGELTDDIIVDTARRKTHVLHRWFEWDDTEAAKEYRRLQARNLIRSFQVVYQDAPDTPVKAYAVHRRERPGSPQRTAYRTMDEVLSDPESRDRLIAEAVRMAMEFRRRFQGIHELSRIIESIEATLPELVESP